MSLSLGTRLGPYDIVVLLGAGGMGEVYRARDRRLGRDVAVKVLPQHLSANPEVRARFEREARTISSLNHPHICTLHDVGREGDTDFLVMELVEGETLADRLAKGALPAEQLLKLGIEITDALDRAHRAGIVHRDLKPGNVMLTKSGSKLMDFGLARPVALGPAGADTQSPTVSRPLTAEGMIVGTFQYMAPEQLEGKEADARADLWALGCVLYEMATGTRAFDGKSQASLIGAIMNTNPPPMSVRAPMTPAALDRAVRQCLAKDPDDRWQTASDLRRELSWIAEGGSQVSPPTARVRRGRERLAWSIATAAVIIAVATLFVEKRPAPRVPAAHASLQPPSGVLFSSSTERPLPLAVSPDGSVVAFCARDGEGADLLWVRSLAKEDARPIAGTEGAEGPFFSPNSHSIGFFAGGKLKRVDVAGGPVISLADRIEARGGTWNRDGVILFTGGAFGPVSRISADGGAVSDATALDTTLTEGTHRYPHFLPDGRHFLYLARRASAGAGESPIIYAGKLGSRERKPILDVASNVIFASGHLIYVRETALVAQRFDTGSLTVTGPVVPLVDNVRVDARFSRGVFAASLNGVLVCMTGSSQTRTQLHWLDRTGRALGDVGEPADYTYGGTPCISPDGQRAAMPIANLDRGTSDIWLVELGSGRRRKLTVDAGDHFAACWSPDGMSVLVGSRSAGDGGLDLVSIDGTGSRRILSRSEGYSWPRSTWGDRLLCEFHSGTPSNNADIHLLRLSGNGTPEAFIATSALEFRAQFSPSGRWVAYESDETGRREVFVVTFPQPGGRWQVSQGGGFEARWSRDGRELFYIDAENYVVSVEVDSAAGSFNPGVSRRLFQFHGTGGPWRYDVAADGRFLVTAPLEEDLGSPVTLITDWTHRLSNQEEERR